MVSEVMLQQTTVAAVEPYFKRWMNRFPAVRDLAAADEAEVLALWQGLGYYRRARNLHAAAKVLAEEYDGIFPRDYGGLRALPGVGDYTAQAVRAFAFDEPAPVLDANIIRVVARLFDMHSAMDKVAGRSEARRALESLLPEFCGREFVSALMDLGALVCRAGSPDCLLCPVKNFCAVKHPERLPIKAPRKPILVRDEHAAWVSDGGKILLQQSVARRWVGLWRLPPLEKVPPGLPSAELVYSIVRERVTLKVFCAPRRSLAAAGEPRRFFPLDDLPAMPSPHLRAIAKMPGQRYLHG